MLIRPCSGAIAFLRRTRNLCEVSCINFSRMKTGPERPNLKNLDTRLSDDQIDKLIDGLQTNFDKDLKEKKKREQQVDDYKMVAFMLVVSAAIAVTSFG